MMKVLARVLATVFVLLALMFAPRRAGSQSNDELNNDGRNTDNVVTQSMGLDRKSYSPLKQVNKSNVKKLVPIWNASLMNEAGELAAPTVYNGVMYVINGKWTFAIDVETGRQIWRTPVQLEPGVTREAITRGPATIYGGETYRVTIHKHLGPPAIETGQHGWKPG